MATLALEPPVARDAASLADWAEALMFVEDLETLSDTDLRDRLSEIGPSDQEEEEADLAPYSQEVEDILREVASRSTDMGGAYPFARTAEGIARRDAGLDSDLYQFLLYLSLRDAPFRKETWSKDVSPLFDFVGEAAVRTLLGAGAVSRRFGWPVTAAVPRPTGPRQALVWLAKEMGTTHDSSTAIKSRGKDMGVDVAVWRPFDDQRPGFPVLLVQCTVSSREWSTTKIKDINVRLWQSYLRQGFEPMSALVVPFRISSPGGLEAWDLGSHDVTMIIDRSRLAELLAQVDPSTITDVSSIRSKVGDWQGRLAI